MIVLKEIWPNPLPFDKLLQQAPARLGQSSLSDSDNHTVRDSLCEFLLRLYGAGIVVFRTDMPLFTPKVSQRPVASPVVRWQAQRSEFVISIFHVAMKVEDEIGRQLLPWLNGNTTEPYLWTNCGSSTNPRTP